MSYILNGTTIKPPNSGGEMNSTQFAQQRVLSGGVGRDYFGSNKRVWRYSYTNSSKADYDTINGLYQTYLSTGTALTWQVTETNYTVSQTNVHVDLLERDFNVTGSDYISDYTLTLTEA